MKNCLLDRLGQMPKRHFFSGNFHVFDPNQLTNITKGELEKYFHFLGTYLCLIFEKSIWEFITNSKKKSISNQTWFFFEFELDFYCLCSLQKSISKSNWFLNFLNLIFRNWKKIERHSIFQKSSGDRQGDMDGPYSKICLSAH